MQNQEIDVKQKALSEMFFVISYTCVTIILTFMTLSIAFFFLKAIIHFPQVISIHAVPSAAMGSHRLCHQLLWEATDCDVTMEQLIM